jgi:hypothetical protein
MLQLFARGNIVYKSLEGRRATGQDGRHFIKLKIESGKWKIVSAF